eukprot:TRINITY_DN4459_c0_g2_i5.p1 TRINITY_DN4459_c0_g2~~TRINITY_DN4459_c0_g2_i5.p1  ORF type:complete len:420 (-),score=94.51 TRINITY_DN4459_c0_g2_i5:111-1370(-)
MYLVWYDHGQSVLSDGFLVGDCICLLGIAMVTKASQFISGPDDFDTAALLWLYLAADGLVILQQLLATWNNRANPQVLPTLQLVALDALPGMALRLGFALRLNVAHNKEWDWAGWSALLDYGCPWLWIVLRGAAQRFCPAHWINRALLDGVPLPQDVAFLDARLARLFTIVISLLLSSSITADWSSLGQSCRAEVLIFPSLLVFSYLPFVTGFDREPGTTVSEHARRRAVATSLAYDHFSCLCAVMFIMLAGLLQRGAQQECSASVVTFGSRNRAQLLLFHAGVLLCSLLRAVMHRRPPERHPKLPRITRLGCRALAAVLPFLRLATGGNGYESDILTLMGCNLACFCVERYGRVAKEQPDGHGGKPDEGPVVFSENRLCDPRKRNNGEEDGACVVMSGGVSGDGGCEAGAAEEFVLSG